MPRHWCLRVRSFVKVDAVRIHDKELTIAVVMNLRDHGRAWLGFVLAAWRSETLVMDYAAD